MMKIKLVLILILFLSATLLAIGASDGMAYAEEADEGQTQQTSAEELMDEIDLSGLEEYFSTLNDGQKSLFGTSLDEYLRKIINGEFEFGYSSFFTYMLGALGIFYRRNERQLRFSISGRNSQFCGNSAGFGNSATADFQRDTRYVGIGHDA